MKLKQFFRDEQAVSPVIGVILMVAITVILAAVIGTFVLGLGDQVQDTNPQVSFSFDYDQSVPELEVTHDGGDAIEEQNLYVSVDGSETQWGSTDSKVTAGNSLTVTANPDQTARVIWKSPNGDQTATLGRWSGPDA